MNFLSALNVCEMPEARLSVKDKTTDYDKVYINAKEHKYIFTSSRPST